MNPVTPLPWIIDTDTGPCVIANSAGRGIAECYEDGEVQDEVDAANAAYIVHSSNAYPRLVAEIQRLCNEIPKAMGSKERWSNTLLRELGEDKPQVSAQKEGK